MYKIAVVGMPQSASTAIHNIAFRLLKSDNFSVETGLYSVDNINSRIRNSYLGQSWMITPKLLENMSSFIKMLPTDSDQLKINDNSLEESINSSKQSFIIKEHHYDKNLFEWADKIICVRRNIAEAIKSRLRRGKKLISKGQIQAGVYWPNDKDARFLKYCDYLVEDCHKKWQSHKTLEIEYEDYADHPVATVEKIKKFLQLENIVDPNDILDKANTYYDYQDTLTLFTDSKITDKSLAIDFNQKNLDYINLIYESSYLKQCESRTPAIKRLKTDFRKADIKVRTEKLRVYLDPALKKILKNSSFVKINFDAVIFKTAEGYTAELIEAEYTAYTVDETGRAIPIKDYDFYRPLNNQFKKLLDEPHYMISYFLIKSWPKNKEGENLHSYCVSYQHVYGMTDE